MHGQVAAMRARWVLLEVAILLDAFFDYAAYNP
jgi:hypothetical protein